MPSTVAYIIYNHAQASRYFIYFMRTPPFLIFANVICFNKVNIVQPSQRIHVYAHGSDVLLHEYTHSNSVPCIPSVYSSKVTARHAVQNTNWGFFASWKIIYPVASKLALFQCAYLLTLKP